MAISSTPRWSYDNTYTTYIYFYEHDIQTTVTKNPNSVDAWIAETENLNRQLSNRVVVGLDVEWRPSYQPGVKNRAAILQLCAGHRCLIFQIMHSPYIPHSLMDFLNNPNYTFTGVGIYEDVENLVRNYGLGRARDGWGLAANVVDLTWLAAQVYGERMKELGLKALAREVIGKEPEKAGHVRLSRWDDEWLSPEQTEYASIDGFLSFEIARVLLNAGGRL